MIRLVLIVLILACGFTPWDVLPSAAAMAVPDAACCNDEAAETACDRESSPDSPCCPDECDDCGITCCHRVLAPTPSFAPGLGLAPCSGASVRPSPAPHGAPARGIDHPPRT